MRRCERGAFVDLCSRLMPMAEMIEHKYSSNGHPSIEELKAAQGTVETADPLDLLGGFWPEDEDIDVFLETLREWRGHAQTDRNSPRT